MAQRQGGPQPTWIQYEFDKVYKLDRLLVWNSNQTLESLLGFGVKNVVVAYSADGEVWTRLGDFEFAQAPGVATYTPDAAVDFGGAVAKYVKLTISSNWGGLVAQYGLSEVRFLYIPVQPREPMPASGAAGRGDRRRSDLAGRSRGRLAQGLLRHGSAGGRPTGPHRSQPSPTTASIRAL